MDNRKNTSIDELANNLSDEQQKILEQFRNDIQNSPVRNLLPKEREIYGSAIMRAIEILPSFRDALAILSPFMDATSSTAYTDKYARVGLSYWFFYLADRETRAIALLHESMHILYNHFPRFSTLGITPMKGNIAGDLEINSNLSMLPKAKTILQDFILPDNESMGFPYYKTMEQYNQLINDKLKENKEESQQNDGSSDSENGSSSSNGSSQDGQSSQSGNSSNSGQQQSSNSGSSGSSGQGNSQSSTNNSSDTGSKYGNSYDDYVRRASGQKPLGSSSLEDMMKDNQSQQQYGNQNGSGENDDNSNGDDVDTSKGSFDDYEKSSKINGPMKTAKTPSYRCDHSTPDRMSAADDAGIEKKSSTSQNIARRNTKARIVEESKSRAAGTGSASDFLKIAAALMDPPKVDWRTLFRRVIAKSYSSSIAGRSFASYKRVNRRSQGSVIFPGMVDYQPSAMLGIDTSGSMGKSDYESLLSEIEGIMKNGMRSKDALRAFCVDTEIKGIELVKSVKDLKLTGGGGTEMAVAFKFVNSLPKKQQPDIFVLGTDGGLYDGDWNIIYPLIRQGKYRTIILITSEYGMNHVPDYIHQVASVIDVSESDKNLNSYG